QPGDDPRRVDWAAFGRSGQLTLRQYREEVSPAVDLVIDVSRSMRADDAKRDRALELALFVAAAAAGANAPLRTLAALGSDTWPVLPVDVDDTRLPATADDAREPGGLDLTQAPLRAGSLRVLI